ncbi:DinB family protein [Flavobacterium sp. ZT3R25]|uniref:DinB family protein n=1 Tax=Flavobacterium galactosi TaxID=3398735 RepID=UPI003A87CB7D
MDKKINQNAVHTLLAEYKKAINELQDIILNISEKNLVFVIDKETPNWDCKSIQTILTHVISSGYSYCIYIQNSRDICSERPEKIIRTSIIQYIKDLDKLLEFTFNTFINISDNDLEESDNTKKIITSWEQLYDIEQLMEHAIVHVLRHRRQIEKFKIILNNEA